MSTAQSITDPIDTPKQDKTLQLALFSSTILVLFIAALTFFMPYVSDVYSISGLYVFLCLIFPLFLLLCSKLTSLKVILDPSVSMDFLRLIILHVNIFFLVTTLVLFNRVNTDYCIFSILFLYFTILVLHKTNDGETGIANKIYPVLKKSAAPVIFFGCIFLFSYTYVKEIFLQYSEYVLTIYNEDKKIFFSVLLCIAVNLYLLFYKKILPRASSNKGMLRLLCLSPVLLFNTENAFEIEHYNAYLGPAIAVLHGKIPLIEVFGQYGLSYLIFTIGFLFLPNNYSVAATIVSGLNIVYLITFLYILKTIIKNPVHFFIIGIPCVFGIYFLNISPPNLYPSYWAMRFLPATLFLLYILNMISKETSPNKILIASILFFNLLWGIDSFVFSSFIYAFYAFLKSESFLNYTKTLSITFIYFSALAALVFLLYFLVYHQIPNYKLYLINVLNYIKPENEIGIVMRYSKPTVCLSFFKSVYISIPILVIFIMLYLRIIYPAVLPKQDNNIDKTLMICFCSILFISYTASRPSLCDTSSLFYLAFISVVYLIQLFDAPYWISFLSKIMLWIMSTIFIIIAACVLRFIEPSILTVNNSLLSQIVHHKIKAKSVNTEIIRNWFRFCPQYSSDKFIDAHFESNALARINPCPTPEHQEIYDTVKKWNQDKVDLLLFHKHMIQVLIAHHKAHPFLVNPINDNMFPELTHLTINKAEKYLKPGTVMVLDKKLDLYAIDFISLQFIQEKFSLKKIDETESLVVLQLMDKNAYTTSDFEIPLVFTNKIILNNGKPTDTIENTTKRVYDTFASLEIDLFKAVPIHAIQIWRRLPDRTPGFPSSKKHFIKTFNITASVDGIHWDLLTSENQFFIHDEKFYHVKITEKTPYRYLKINFLDDNAVYIQKIYIWPIPG